MTTTDHESFQPDDAPAPEQPPDPSEYSDDAGGPDPGGDLLIRQHRVAHELLGDWYLMPAVAAGWKPLPLELFPSERLRAIAKVANAGVAPSHLALALHRNGDGKLWGNANDAEVFLVEIATRALPTDKLVRELKGLHAKRRLFYGLDQAKLKLDERGLDRTLEDLLALKPAPEVQPFVITPVADLFQPLGPEPWICEGVALQPGAPMIISGHSGRGKSWLTYDLALAVASGQDFGCFPCKRGRVLWFHLEGSSRDLRRRLQRLALGRHLGPTDLDGWFANAVFADLMLGAPETEARLVRECAGVTLAVIDTLAVATTGLDENSSQFRRPLDMLARVSERTGCAFVVIHHHRKDPNDQKQKVDAEMAIRGSSALVNACAVHWAITRAGKAEPGTLFRSRLQMSKSWYGLRDPLLVVGAFSSDNDGAVEVSVTSVDDEQLDKPPEINWQELDDAIIDAARSRANLTLRGLYSVLREQGVRLRESAIRGRVELLESKGALVTRPGPARSVLVALADLVAPSTEVAGPPSNEPRPEGF